MSESDDEDFACYGTPLEPFDEDNVPKKKAFTIQDQIATDKHGRRRFHGAFTGGFSAGFYNSVGTLEGWKPTSFKSSRESKAERQSQRPEDFMDEEDTEEFGIAPTVLRAKPEYSGSSKRHRPILSEGPIPGEPVLHSILQPAKETVGVQLLTKMGWKPGQGLGPKLTWRQKMPSEEEPQLVGLSPDTMFPPDPVHEIFVAPKMDKLGMGYVGLSKEPVLSQRFSLFEEPPSFKMKENKKNISIRGQAFGVGAFEEEDDDIYGGDDMSRYDFALESSSSLKESRKRRDEEERNKGRMAITEGGDWIQGFVPAKNIRSRIKYFPPPELPPDFDPNGSGARKTRFDAGKPEVPSSVGPNFKHILNAEERASILGDLPRKEEASEKKELENQNTEDNLEKGSVEGERFRPFLSDPGKQERYDRYLNFVRIGAKDALTAIQPPTMTSWEKEREAAEFQQAARLYQPLSGLMSERFSRAILPDDYMGPLPTSGDDQQREEPPWVRAAREEKFGNLTRSQEDWEPGPLLCKRMNIPHPGGITLSQVAQEANKRKPKFAVFDFLNCSKGNNNYSVDIANDTVPSPDDHVGEVEEGGREDPEGEEGPRSRLALPLPNFPDTLEFEDPKEKMDLFKAIFCSSDEDDEENLEKGEEGQSVKKIEKSASNLDPGRLNPLRNTSPPRGIFANLDLDALSAHLHQPKTTAPAESNSKLPELMDSNKEKEKAVESDVSLMYGPCLPTKPVFIPKKTEEKSRTEGVHSEDSGSSSTEGSNSEWVEKGGTSGQKKKGKEKKRSKKTKREKHKKRDKHKKKKKKKR